MTSADWSETATASQTKEGTREERKQRTVAFTCFVRLSLNASYEKQRKAARYIFKREIIVLTATKEKEKEEFGGHRSLCGSP